MPIVDLPNQLQMYYDDDDFTDPWTDAETVILHHGNAKNARLWYAWVPRLAGDYRVIRLDARGFGRSTVPDPGEYAWLLSGFAEDVAHLMDYLEIDKTHLVGETIGGTIALQFAHDFPQRLHSVTACTSPYKFTGAPRYLEYYELVKAQGVAAWVQQTSGQRLEPDASGSDHNAWYIDQMSQTSQHVVMETLAYLSGVDLTPILPQIQTPALTLVGEYSVMNTEERVQSMVDLLPNGRAVVVPGASGYVQHSAPGPCVDIWREFVDGLKS